MSVTSLKLIACPDWPSHGSDGPALCTQTGSQVKMLLTEWSFGYSNIFEAKLTWKEKIYL